MLKRKTSDNQKTEISSKEFTKKFIKNLIFNGIIIGIVFAVIYALIEQFIQNNVVSAIIYFILLFVVIYKIYVEAIKDTFYDSYITGDNIRKAKNNIIIIFTIIALVNIILDILPLIRVINYIGVLYSYIIQPIVSIISNILLYIIIIIFCRDEIDIICAGGQVDNKKYIIKKIILICVYAIALIAGSIFVNNQYKSSVNDYMNNGGNITNTHEEDIDTIEVSTLNEINCELSENTITEIPEGQKDYYKTEDGSVEIDISKIYDKVIEREIYNLKVITDGAIIFYERGGNNYIEKLDMDGENCWTYETTRSFKFNELIEVDDGYFMIGTVDGKNIIIKLNKQGVAVIAQYFDENITDANFIESDTENIKIAGKNIDGSIEIIIYDIDGNQIEVLNTNLIGITPEKIIENNEDYYGIGKNEDLQQTNIQYYFKLDNIGNVIFNYDINQREEDGGYLGENIIDIAVNDNYIYLILEIFTKEVYAFDLEGEVVKKFGYNGNGLISNVSPLKIKATYDGVNVYGWTREGGTIDIISNEFVFLERINIPHTQLEEGFIQIGDSKLLNDRYIALEENTDGSLYIYQYKFEY